MCVCVCVSTMDENARKRATQPACKRRQRSVLVFGESGWGRVWVCVLNLVAVAERCVARAESRVER